ncbi:MAG: zf-TFIIB domain-containing protein [Sedimentisphaerales bacterium]|nr:zf-TFIIB domain-containing protein [Sedimentisphaerales bacterium]
MKCPKCNGDMESVQYEDIEVDRCTSCEGIWFDMLEADKLRTMSGSEAIDTGDPKLGREYDDIHNVICPKCQTQMIHMVDRRKPYIQYEACTVCYGLFFDAGEFRQFKHQTVLDFFRNLSARSRKK